MARRNGYFVKFMASTNDASMKSPVAPESSNAIVLNGRWLSTDSSCSLSSLLWRGRLDRMRMKSANFSAGLRGGGVAWLLSDSTCSDMGGKRSISDVELLHELRELRTEKRFVRQGTPFTADRGENPLSCALHGCFELPLSFPEVPP